MRSPFSYSPFSLSDLNKGVKWLVLTSGVIYVIQVFGGRGFLLTFGLVPYQVTRNFWLWQLFTYMFLHGGLFHLLFNLFILWMFGKSVETAWGTKAFLKYYFTCGLGAAAFITLTSPASMLPNIGASGAIYGILAAFAMLYPDAVIYLYFFIPMRAKHLTVLLGVIAFLAGISGSQSGIAHFGHLGGLLVGYFYLKYPVWKYRLHLPRVNWRGLFKKRIREREGSEEKINRILDKILAQGVESLTSEERNIMDDYARRKR